MRQLQVGTGVGSKNLKFRTGIYYIIISVSRFPAVLHTIVLYGVIIIIHLPLEKPTREACAAVGEARCLHFMPEISLLVNKQARSWEQELF